MIELDYRSKRETFCGPLALLSIFGIILSLASIFTGKSIPIGAIGLALSIFLIKLSLSWFFHLERKFQFEPESGEIKKVTLYNKEITDSVVIANSKDVEAFAVVGVKHWGKARYWWTYHVSIIMKDGSAIQITTPKNKNHQSDWKKAEEIANAMSCNFFSGAHEQTLEIKKTPDKIELANRDWRFADLIKYEGIGILLSIAFFASILLFIVGLTVILS